MYRVAQWWFLVALAGVFGCDGAESAPWDTALAVPPLESADGEPEWAPADVAAAWNAGVASGWPNAGQVHDVYVELMSHGDSTCPGDPLELYGDVILGCVADSGYSYSGVSVYRSTEENVDGVVTGFRGVHADMRIVTAEGASMWAGGSAYQGWEIGGGQTVFRDYFEGTWIWDADDGPLADGVSGLATTSVTRTESGDIVSFSGALGFSGIAISADEFSVDEAGCASGELLVRDPTLGWHSASFDGCDGCAVVTHDNGQSGEACFDLAPLLAVADAQLGAR